MVVGITIMKTNKMEHFVCGVLATYGLVVACGNMEESNQSGRKCTINPATWCNWGGKPGVSQNINNTQNNPNDSNENNTAEEQH